FHPVLFVFVFNDTDYTFFFTLSLHDALPILSSKYNLPVIIVAENNVYEATRIVKAISSGASDYYVIKDEDKEETKSKQQGILSSKLKHTTRQQKKKSKRNKVKHKNQTQEKQNKPLKKEGI